MKLLFALSMTALAPLAFAGGVERFCNGQGTLEDGTVFGPVAERWGPSIGPTEIPWTIDTGPMGADQVVPGFPTVACSAAALGPDVTTYPGVQSLVRGAQAWAQAIYPAGVLEGDMTPGVGATEVGAVAAAFSLATPTLASLGGLTLLDGMNAVSFWEPMATFGGAMTIALASVVPLTTTGEIIEADIAFNADARDALGDVVFSFVEDNEAFGATFASTGVTALPTFGYVPPVDAFVDIQGVATHEFGHFAGLAHSLIDSRTNGVVSRQPTMFDLAMVQRYFATFAVPDGSCTPGTWGTASTLGAATTVGGILGRASRTLELDDLAAIGDAYPTAEFAAQTGTISGTIRRHNPADHPFPRPYIGASVVAVHKDEPDRFRVGTLSYDSGTYSIPGLVPGDYYVYTEPVTDFGFQGAFFSAPTLPNFLWPPLPSPTSGTTGIYGACINQTHPFHTVIDFYDDAEGITETSFSNVAAITVGPGEEREGINITANSNFYNKLSVRIDNPGIRDSNRGVLIQPEVDSFPRLVFGIPGDSGDPVELHFNDRRTSVIENGQLIQVEGRDLPGVPGVVTGNIGFSSFVYELQLTPASGYRNMFVQARIGTGAELRVSNAVSVWVTHP